MSSAITDGVIEITFNATLLQEFQAIDFVAWLVDSGRMQGAHYKKVLLHLVEGDPALDSYGVDTETQADNDFLRALFHTGRKAGQNFPEENFVASGVKGGLKLKQQLG